MLALGKWAKVRVHEAYKAMRCKLVFAVRGSFLPIPSLTSARQYWVGAQKLFRLAALLPGDDTVSPFVYGHRAAKALDRP
jgi:hypothetical protein